MKLHWVLGGLLMAGCASQPTFEPEVDGAGSIESRGGVVDSIPADNPALKVRFVSMIIPKKTMLHVRVYLLRKRDSVTITLDPQEQSISLPDLAVPIHPTRIHASGVSQPLIKMIDSSRQVVEFVFSLPESKSHQYPYINLNWVVHYQEAGQTRTVARTERFDYVDKKIESRQGVGQYDHDLDFPQAGYMDPLPNDWQPTGWQWW